MRKCDTMVDFDEIARNILTPVRKAEPVVRAGPVLKKEYRVGGKYRKMT
jgi:hypothetical protein